MVGRLVVLGVGALLCGGCHDFDALIRHGSDSGTMVDASDDAADGHDATMPCVPGCSGGTWTECIDSKTVEHECALGCATAEACKTISPKWWDEANARRLPRATEDLIVPAHTEWLIWTKATGNDPVIYETPDSKPFPIWIPGKGFPKDFATDAQPDFDWSEEDLGPAGNQKPVVVIWVRDFRVPDTSKVYAWDGRPVIIAASRDIKIDGVFDAGSRPVPLVGGAGAVPKGGWIAELGHPGAGGNGGETSQQNPFSGGWCFGGGGGGYATAGAAGGALFGQTGDGGSAGATVPIQGYVGGAVGGGGGALNTKEFTGAGIGGGVAAFVALGGINVSGGITVGGGAGWGGRSGPEPTSPNGAGGQGAMCFGFLLGEACSGAFGEVGSLTPGASGGMGNVPSPLVGTPAMGGNGSNDVGVATAGEGRRAIGGDNATSGSGGGGGAGYVVIRRDAAHYSMLGNIYPHVTDSLPVVEDLEYLEE